MLHSRSWLTMVFAALFFFFCLSVSCSAQTLPLTPLVPYSYFPASTLYAPYAGYGTWFTPFPMYIPPYPLAAPITPFPSLTLPRTSNAVTIITVPASTNTVTSSAPLGTLNLTPSTLVLLLLYFTLH